jgi:hypothetical protein
LARGVDVGEGGLRLRSARAREVGKSELPTPGASVRLLLGIAEGGWLRLSGRLLRQRDGELALVFEHPCAEALRQLRRLIEALLAAEVAVRLPPPGEPVALEPELIDEPTPRRELEAQGNTRDVLPEVMADLAAKDPTLKLSSTEVVALREACRDPAADA